jgi:hypothetical protein
MHRKLIGLASSFALTALATLGACTTSSSTTPRAEGGVGEGGVKKEAGTTPTTDAGAACYDDAAAATYPNTMVVAAQKGACTDADIAAFSTACFGTGKAATCDQFAKDKPACMSCLYTGDATNAAGKTILAALVPFGQDQVVPNTEACAAITLKNEAACGLSYVNEASCLVTSCDTCADADFDTCVNTAADDICAPLLVDPAGSCGKALSDGKAAVDAACGGATFEEIFPKVAAVLCK